MDCYVQVWIHRCGCGFLCAGVDSPLWVWIQVLGVSGTMEALGRHEWAVMNRYGIETYTKVRHVYDAE